KNLNINRGIQTRLTNFVEMIKAFQIHAKRDNAFQVAEMVTKKTGLLQEMKKDGTPEGIMRIENVEELLNGIRDFVEGQEDVADARGSLAEFLEDVALLTDLDKETPNEDRVSLMTVHSAKGLEFPYVYIVGLEEDLFPSAMSMNTRSELEEERRLFYVALTRAEKKAYLTHVESRYRWGKLIDADPSRFIGEIDEEFVEFMAPDDSYKFRPMLDTDIFGEVDKSRLRQTKPRKGTPPPAHKPTEEQLRKLRRLRPKNSPKMTKSKTPMLQLNEGQTVEHNRFGVGQVLNIEGAGQDKKAEIDFDKGGIKKILLRFAKLKVLN
ncbi:MAG TPA: 3'-5' exonuclease, partial [Flavobacteriaceae bacterium]|nr:3'-5' exonuclease [Flavobacteriaceae bacterium]